MTNNRGRKNPGFQQSRDHIRLVEEEGYTLKTFPMEYSDERKAEDGSGPANNQRIHVTAFGQKTYENW